MEHTVDIYWDDLPEHIQEELLDLGYGNINIFSGIFPVTTIFVYIK